MSDWSPPAGHTGRWILACAAGAAVGLVLATLWNALLLPAIAPGAGGIPLLAPLLQALGGAIFGACLGSVQAAVLRGPYPDLPMAPWIAVTAAAGYLAALGLNLIYGVLAQHAGSIPIALFILAGAALKGVLSGLLYGPAQGRVLDRVVADRASWTRVVMVGFMLGAILGSMRWLIGPTTRDALSLAIGALVGGALEGLALGLVTASAFRFMPPRGARRSPP
jgi:hypothetical protein